ncbi:hypothetical protein TNIN_278331 [Trichonephila inaurata madagascariensis]|uniref:Uncharacterized protein n=1 Tax=Trichonephila inaurata madagascariensis TaxID=2747483 RepID=A0A8X6WXC5_9ARAC|nr:hypothetical protein TNIN_278331 [Trichonephila inaurata madagascariensis]
MRTVQCAIHLKITIRCVLANPFASNKPEMVIGGETRFCRGRRKTNWPSQRAPRAFLEWKRSPTFFAPPCTAARGREEKESNTGGRFANTSFYKRNQI